MLEVPSAVTGECIFCSSGPCRRFSEGLKTARFAQMIGIPRFRLPYSDNRKRGMPIV